MRKMLLAAVLLIASASAAGAQESDNQTPSAETLRETIACPKLDDVQRAQTLAVGRTLIAALAALRYALDHGCTSFDENTFVKVDERVTTGTFQRYFCIRPRDFGQTCFWVPADNIIVPVR